MCLTTRHACLTCDALDAMRPSRRRVVVRPFAALAVTLFLGSLLPFVSGSVSNHGSQGTALDLTGVIDVTPLDDHILTLTGGFTPPDFGEDQVVEVDAAVLFAALVNYTVVVSFTVPWCGLCVGYAPEFTRVAQAYEGLVEAKSKKPIVFLSIVVDTDDNRKLAKTFGVNSVPFVTVLKHKRWYTVSGKDGSVQIRKPKRYDGYLGAAPTAEFIFQETKVNAFERNDEGEDTGVFERDDTMKDTPSRSRKPLRPYVHELTNETIDAFINDSSNDVLLEFYTPWCGHCKRFEKFYFEVGAHFFDVSDKRVARIDVDKYREVAQKYDVQGLPSLQLFPKGYKKRGLHFKNSERRPADIIAFVKSPLVWLVEAKVLDMPEWHCVVWLEKKGVLKGEGDEDSVSAVVGLTGDLENRIEVDPSLRLNSHADDITIHSTAAASMFSDAHGWARRGRWLETVEVLTCLSHTKPLRHTGLGSSPSMWNFLDNAKMHVENPEVTIVNGVVGGQNSFGTTNATAEDSINLALEESERVNPDGEDWSSFGGNDGTQWEEREASGFDWEMWEAFVAREVGDAYGEIPEISDS